MRKTQAGLQREKQDLQTALDSLKADMAKKARTPGRFGSPMTPNGGDMAARLAYEFTDEEDDHSVISPRKQKVDTSLSYTPSQSLSAELSAADPTPEVLPIKPPQSGQAAVELDNLKSNLSRAHSQISMLKSRLQREKGPRSPEGKKNSIDISSDGEGVWLDEDLGGEVLGVETSPAPRRASTPARRGSKSGRSITRSSRGLTVIQQLNAAKTTPQAAEGSVATNDAPEGFGPLLDEPSMFNGDTDGQEGHEKAARGLPEEEEDGSESETERSTQTQRPDSMVSVEGMDPMFANVLKTPSASPAPARDHAPFTPSPLRRASSITKTRNNRATRRSRGGAAFKGTRPPSIHGSKMGALAEELGFGGEGDISTLTQPDQTLEEEEYVDVEGEDVPKRVFVDAGVQYEAVEEEAKLAAESQAEHETVAVPVPVEPVRGSTPEPVPISEPAPAKEMAEFGVQVGPAPLPPVPEIVKVDASIQTTEKVSVEMATETDPEPVVVPPVMVEMGTNTVEEWPVVPVPPKTAEVGTETEPIPVAVSAAAVGPRRPTIMPPPSSFHDPALHSARTDTDGDSDYEDARETVAGTSRSQSAADFVSMHDMSPDEEDADGEGEERDSDDDSDAESIKVSRLHYKRPPPAPAAPPSPPPVEYATASVQADAPKSEMAETGTQTDEWVPPALPALFRVGPQQQQFQFITPAVAAAAAGSSSPTQATHPPHPPPSPALGPSFQAAIARSRFNTAVTLPEPASTKDDSGRPRVPSTPTGSPRVDRTRPPTMMLPPPPKLPPPPSLPSTLSPPRTAPPRPSSPPPADLVQRAQTPLQRTPVSSMNNLAVPSPGKSSVIRQAPSTPTPIRPAPSAGSFRSASVHHQSLNAAAMADLNGRHKEGSMVSSRRSTSSRRPSISSSLSSEQQQHAVRALEHHIGSPTRTNTGLSSANGNDQSASTDPNIIHAITQTMIGEFLYKYTRKAIGKGHAERRHKRFFWIHPYTKTIYWSAVDPGASNVHESSAKSGE